MNEQMEKEFKDNSNMDMATLKWSLKIAWQINPVLFTLWIIMDIISAILPVIFMGLVSYMVDKISENVSAGLGMESVISLLIALTLIMIFNGIFVKIPDVLWTKLGNDFNVGMQRKMGKFMRIVPVKYFDDAATAKIMSVAQRKEDSLGNFIGEVFTVAMRVVYLFSILLLAIKTSWLLVVVFIIYVTVVMIIGTHDAKASYGTHYELEDDRFFIDYYMNLVMKKNPKDLRLLQMGAYINKRWREHRKHILNEEIKISQKNVKNWSLVQLLESIFKCVLLFCGLLLLKRGFLTLGSLTLFLTVLSQIGDVCIDLGYLWKDLYIIGCDMKFKKMMMEWDFTKKRPLPEYGLNQPQNNHDSDAPVIFELQHVSFSYDGVTKVLQDISLTIHEGESIALVGENGAGKSTLVKLLLGLYEPDEGEIYFKGKNYRELDMNEFVKQIGVVFQDFVHFELLARENIAFGDISKVRDDEALHYATAMGGADNVIKKLPKGLDNYLGRWYEQEGGEMSGGEWQRVAVSRAYISDRKILIMDEPAAALDPIAEMEQFSRIRNKLDKRTSVLISHRIGFARLADKIVVLNKGKIAEYGTHKELTDRNGLYSEMFNNQALWYLGGGE